MTIVPNCYSRHALCSLLVNKTVASPKASGLRFEPCSMGKLTVFSKRVFFCRDFATATNTYSIFLVFVLHLVVARSELISVDYSDGCGSKSTIKFDVHLGGLVGFRCCYTISVTACRFFQRRSHH